MCLIPHDPDWTEVTPSKPFIAYQPNPPLQFPNIVPYPGPTALQTAIENKLRSASTPAAEEAIMFDLLWKFARGDWHGVSDAANDLRVEEAKRGK